MGRRGSIRANVLRLDDIDPAGDFFASDPDHHDNLILAEGDSWFSIGGFPPTNLLYGLRFRKHTMVVSCAEPGDTIKHMAEIVNNKLYRRALSKTHGYDWDMLLLSGGGNDLIDAANNIVLAPAKRSSAEPANPSGYVNHEKLGKLLARIESGYRKLADQRDSAQSRSQGKPIVTHTYDYITPRNEPARFFGFPLSGPWLYKAFNNRKVPQKDWIALADYLIDSLADSILGLQNGSNKISNFHVVDTRNTLTRAKLQDFGPTTHWLNEIHPNHDGYKEIGRKIERGKLYEILYGGF